MSELLNKKIWKIYLSGEVHSDWRDELLTAVEQEQLPVELYNPVTDHEKSDNCGTRILGEEKDVIWRDHKSAKINSIRNKILITDADIVVIRFGDKYRQWNAAFDAGFAYANGKPIVLIHPLEFTHALKEIDAVAHAVVRDTSQVIEILKYITD
jgi:YtoQ family protein